MADPGGGVPPSRWRPRIRGRWLAVAAAALAVTAADWYAHRLGDLLGDRFAGRRWDLPARVYGRPLEIWDGRPLSGSALEEELELAGYRREPGGAAGTWERAGSRFSIVSRPFLFPDGRQPRQQVRLSVAGGEVALPAGAPAVARLDPPLIGSFYPGSREDRVLVRLADVDPVLVRTLLLVEDRSFFAHPGFDLRAIARAFWVNLRRGAAVQGGSTITQQLVKNYFLSPERTLRRKLDELGLAVYLELRYDKEEILEAYLNEVYLGQGGGRAVHGFGTAAGFYFGRPPEELRPEEIALLVGLLKGPSRYNPWTEPERARARRDVVLGVMRDGGLIDGERHRALVAAPLGVLARPPSGESRAPAFLDLVRRQLLEEYPEEELRTEGLRVFTSLDPQAQLAAERAVAAGLPVLERRAGARPGTLETAVVVTAWPSSEVIALVGGRTPGAGGFNRALDARRQIGSLVKPAVYLAALEQPERWNLASTLADEQIAVGRGRSRWSPRNNDGRFRGPVPLHRALEQSLNVPTVRLGLEVGLPNVVAALGRLGVTRGIEPLPSLLLGALELTPVETAAVYQTIAAGGNASPLRAIRTVTTPEGRTLSRNPLRIEPRFEARAVFLLQHALQRAAAEGTAAAAARRLPGVDPAGKTGTTDGLRDSWFAGYAGDRLAVVWVGRDDGSPAGLTGSAGALDLWIGTMRRISPSPLRPREPEGVAWMRADDGAILPYIPVPGREPEPPPAPQARKRGRFMRWLRDLFR